MSISSYEIPIDQFFFSDIEGIVWHKQSITLYASDLGLIRVSLELHTDAQGWVALKDQSLFGYSPDICGPILGGGFNPTKPYYITVDLHSDHLTLLGILYNGEPVEEWMEQDSVSATLRAAENFLLISTLQPITPKTQWGMTTTYSTSHHT